MLARRHRKMATADIKRTAPSSAVQGGWALFVLLAGVAGVAEPVLACRMFLRAYLVRAWCLRGARNSSRSPQTSTSDCVSLGGDEFQSHDPGDDQEYTKQPDQRRWFP